MNRTRMLVATTLVAAVAAGLAACSHSTNASSSGATGGLDGTALSAPAAEPSAAAGSAAGPVKAGQAGGAASTTGDAVDTAVTLNSPALIRTADLAVRIAHASGVAPAADRAEQIAVDSGGRVDSDDRTSGPTATAALTLKVPPAALTAVLGRLSALGTEQSRRLGTQDVTTQLVDVSSRVASAQAAIAQLDRIYAQATKVSDVIAIETTLSEREADLESLEAQRNDLQTQTALATVTLNLTAAAPTAAKHHRPSGFVGGLRHGWHNFAQAASWLAGAVGAVLPFALLVALVAAAGAVIRRRVRGSGPRVPEVQPDVA